MKILHTICAIGFLFVPLCGNAAYGESVNHGSFSGAHFQFNNVVEDSDTDPLPLFGPPTLLVDQLLFNPTSFDSISNSAIPSDITDSQIRMTIVANPGSGIGAIHLQESGDYTLIGPPTVSDAGAMVAASVFVRIQRVNGVPLETTITRSVNMEFDAPNNGVFQMSQDGIAAGKIYQGWLNIDLDEILAEMDHVGVATEVELTWDNTLTTWSVGGASALIKKKDFQTAFSVIPSIPEPASLLLGFGVLVGLLGGRRFRRS